MEQLSQSRRIRAVVFPYMTEEILSSCRLKPLIGQFYHKILQTCLRYCSCKADKQKGKNPAGLWLFLTKKREEVNDLFGQDVIFVTVFSRICKMS